MSIEITVNGNPHTIPKNSSLTELLELLGVEGRLAVDINGEIIPKSTHSDQLIADSDRIEIVHAIGGG